MNKQKKINGGKLSMKKVASKRAKLLSVLCLATLVPFGVGMATLNANADVDVTNFRILSGAGVRLPNANDDSGIRFTAQLPSTAFTSLTENQENAVFFGIQLTGENGATSDVCYYVDDKAKEGVTNEREVGEFNASGYFNYYASVLYNNEQLKADLATSEAHNPEYNTYDNDEARIENFDETLLQKYLNKAYATELSARAYYQIGMEGEKMPVGFSAVRSVWGVASNAYITDATKYTGVANKYFSSIDTVEKEVTIAYETGKVIGYEFAETDRVYIAGQARSLTNDSIATSVYSNNQVGDTIKLAVVSEAGALTVLNATLESTVTTVSTLAYYDAAADKVYYTDENGAQQTLAGSAAASFNYVADETTSYALADYTSGSLVSNVNYKYADSVYFNINERGNAYVDYRGGHVQYLQPKLKTESEDIMIQIPYNPQKDVYTGVKVMIETENKTYQFTNTVITSQMIDDAAELDSIFNKADMNADSSTNNYVLKSASIVQYGTITKGVYMLANDIDCTTGFTFDNSAWNYFEGVLDGRGHNISNLDVSGTESNPGNGLFSATSTYSAIQNIGFINVKANYGSVFQGNMFDYVKSTATVVATYYMADGTTSTTDGSAGLGSKYYRNQLVDESDTTTTIGELLKSGYRQGAAGLYGQGGYFQNVYVQVDPSTQRLMGVICRNMLNRPNTVRANNMVIEYVPKKLYDSAEGANDGALPYEYDYTNGKYGVVFGGAYENSSMSWIPQYETVEHLDNYTNVKYFTPSTSFVNQTMQSGASLNFYRPTGAYSYGTWFTYRLYVISPVGLVASANGSILGTNEATTEANPYKFEALTAWSHYDKPLADTVYANDYSKLERYDSYEAYAAAYGVGATNQQLTSYMFDNGAEENYWDISGGYLQWRNIPQTNE